MTGNERDQRDESLDRAILSYVECEPRRGLEQRILRRVAVRRRREWAWMWAVAACFALAVIFGLIGIPGDVATPPMITRAPVPLATVKFRTVSVSVPHTRRPTVIRQSAAQRDVFPTPTPLTEEERIAFGFLRRDLLAVTVPAQIGTPIEIPEIRIDPISDGGSE